MKKILFASLLAGACMSAFGADGAALYKKCAVCHGANAEKVYLGKVPALNTLSSADRLAALKEYAAGTKNSYGQGKLMTLNVKNLSEEDFKAIESYIESLKK